MRPRSSRVTQGFRLGNGGQRANSSNSSRGPVESRERALRRRKKTTNTPSGAFREEFACQEPSSRQIAAKGGGRRAAGGGASRVRRGDGARPVTHLGIEFLDGRVREGGVAQAAAGLGDGLQGLGTCASFEKVMPSAKSTTRWNRPEAGPGRRRARALAAWGGTRADRSRRGEGPVRDRANAASAASRARGRDGLTTGEIWARRTLLLVRGADHEGAARGGARGGRGAHLGGAGRDARLRGEERGGVGDGGHVVSRVEQTADARSREEELVCLRRNS